MKQKNLPIGYWIKRADETLTKGINEIHAQFGLTRTDWQILNCLKENNEISKTELLNIMQPFADELLVQKILNNLMNEKILDGQNSKLKLTQKGLEIHHQCFERQNIFRNRSMDGISEKEYQITYDTLKRLVSNIEP